MYSGCSSTKHVNKVFNDGQDETYDEIVEPAAASASRDYAAGSAKNSSDYQRSSTGQNKYETLPHQAGAVDENTYDKIAEDGNY
jgi:hypothetical protein